MTRGSLGNCFSSRVNHPATGVGLLRARSCRTPIFASLRAASEATAIGPISELGPHGREEPRKLPIAGPRGGLRSLEEFMRIYGSLPLPWTRMFGLVNAHFAAAGKGEGSKFSPTLLAHIRDLHIL
jgi:hypothetical protein